MKDKQVTVKDLEKGTLTDFKSNAEMNDVAMCDVPIRSEHCAASLSLADTHIVKNDSKNSTETGSDHTEHMGNVSSIPRALPRRSLLCWGVCLLLTTVVILLGTAGSRVRRNVTTPQILHPEHNDVIEYLLSHNISSHEDLTEDNSPQNLASRWLAESDPAQMPLPGAYDYLYVTRYVMALNYFALNGDAWTKKVNFMTGKHVCDWNDLKNAFGNKGVETGGLSCDKNRMPVVLDLEYNSLFGTIPTENGLLATLTVFDVEVNDYIWGTFPTELCNLVNLESLTLRGNDLGGNLPSCLGKLQKLRYFNTESNNFVGPLPKDLCAMTHMQYFVMQRNLLRENLPSCMGTWSRLKVLAISDNALSGTLPTELMNMKHLQELTIDDNKFRGDPLPVINELTDLKIIYASGNNFTGTLNSQSCQNLQQLEIFDISNNNFTSTELPTHLLQMPKLEVLDLSWNSLEDSLPQDIQENTVLWFFTANNNFLDGSLPSALKNLTYLRHLDLSDNRFQGSLRSEIFQMTSLENLFLSENPFLHQGKIPDTISGMTQLKELSLKNTNRNGTLPELLDFVNLKLLDLDNNACSGTIPSSYANLRNLVYLMLNRNPIQGLVPDFRNAKHLHTVLLDGTGLPSFIGDPDSAARPIAVAECAGGSGRVLCSCCHCCDTDTARSGSCADPFVASLDWTWEYGFQREIRDFGINRSALAKPIV